MTESHDVTAAANMEPTASLPGPITPPEPEAWAYELPEPEEPPPWRHRILSTAVPAVISVLIGAGAVLGVLHFTDKPAPSPEPAAVESMPPPPVVMKSPDQEYIAKLAEHGISAANTEAMRQLYMAYAHQACYSLAPPQAQPFNAVAANIVATQNSVIEIMSGSVWVPAVTMANAEDMIRVGVEVYCPMFAEGLE